jgi:hypothetical protein
LAGEQAGCWLAGPLGGGAVELITRGSTGLSLRHPASAAIATARQPKINATRMIDPLSRFAIRATVDAAGRSPPELAAPGIDLDQAALRRSIRIFENWAVLARSEEH